MKISKEPPEHIPPKHLSKRSAAFWREMNTRFIFEAHDLQRLRTACEAMDTIDQAEAAVRKDGLMILDRYKVPKSHPALVVARDARQLLLRALREMAVDVELPNEARIPRQSRRYG